MRAQSWPGTIACPACAVAVPLPMTAEVSDGPAIMVSLRYDEETAIVALIDHIASEHGPVQRGPAARVLSTYIHDQLALATEGARATVEEMFASIGIPVSE